MRHQELAHLLRAACDITRDPRVLVQGSPSVLGAFDEEHLL